MKISEIYRKYQINKGLQEHMIRVAAVAKKICDNARINLPADHIVDGCLVHDMGNLIKAKMDSFQEFFEPEGVEYWTQVQTSMISKYGTDVHGATIDMVKDMKLDPLSYKYFAAIGGEATERVHKSQDLGEKIATYCDMRAGPFGVISLAQRMNDIRERYIGRDIEGFTADEINLRAQRLVGMEQEIFSHSNIAPEDITDDSTKAIQAELWNWEIKTTD